MGARAPDLLTRHHVVVAVALRPRPQGGEVRPGGRLREALAPDVLAPEDPGKVEAALFLGALGDQGRSRVHHPDEVDADVRGVGAGVLLEVDELLGDRQAATAGFGRPGDTGVAGVVELALPGGVVGAAGVPVPGRRRRAVLVDLDLEPRRGPRPGTPRRRRSTAGPWQSVPGEVGRFEGGPHVDEVDLSGVGARQHVDEADRRWGARSGASRPPRWSSRSCSDGACAGSRSSTIATGTAPSRPSAMPMTAAPRTAGCDSSAARTSSGRTLKPPRMIAWSARPRIQRKPSSSMRARSVVRIHPLPSPSCAALTSSRPTSSAPST